jgi:hypothetical protein
MNTKHTPGPWRENSQGDSEYIFSEVYGAIATIPHGGIHRDKHKANAERIVACVNALNGIEDPLKVRDAFDSLQAHNLTPFSLNELINERFHLKRIVNKDIDAMAKLQEDYEKLLIAFKEISEIVDKMKTFN